MGSCVNKAPVLKNPHDHADEFEETPQRKVEERQKRQQQIANLMGLEMDVNNNTEFTPVIGFNTEATRLDYSKSFQIPLEELSRSMSASEDCSQPLFIWQLYSLLGEVRIRAIVHAFYTRVFADCDGWFRVPFEVAGFDHHVKRATDFWLDAMGGGKRYYGGDGRLDLMHSRESSIIILTARGAERWMNHMSKAVQLADLGPDPRVRKTVKDFLRVHVRKYGKSFHFNPGRAENQLEGD